jgi:triacylglycerol lipase
MNIILAHGILGFDRIGRLEYFNGIKEYLEGAYEGVKVLTTVVKPTDSIETRSKQLREQILTALGQNGQSPLLNPDEETHIIAHSMGGLDSRYILSPDNQSPHGERHIAEFITSLTTIGTPHSGSPIADLFYKSFGRNEAQKILIRKSLRLIGISTEGLRDLTSDAMGDFNAKYGDNSGVRYFWAAGVGKSTGPVTSAPFLPTHEYIRFKGESDEEKTSDGVVPLSSAKREAEGWEPVGSLWEADHAEEVGHSLDEYLWPHGALKVLAVALRYEPDNAPPEPQILAKYDEIMARIEPLRKR